MDSIKWHTASSKLVQLAMPRVETRGSENEEEIAGYRNHFNSRRPQHHASRDTRGNNGPFWRHNS